MITDHIHNWKLYPYGDAWSRAFSFLEKLTAETAAGDYEIINKDVFARVMEYETRDESEGVLESHRQYIDIQTTLQGAEGMFYIPVGNLKIKKPYNTEEDVIYYHYASSYPGRIDVYPGQFITFFPHDAHMPQMIVGEKQFIKKAVVKIKVDLLGL